MDKYPIVRGWAGILRVAGWIAIVIGGILFVVGLANLGGGASSGTAEIGNAFTMIRGILGMVGGSAIIVSGILLVVWGEIIQVFLDIEENTRSARDELAKLRQEKALPVPSAPAPLNLNCAKCGHRNAQDARFCESCGSAL